MKDPFDAMRSALVEASNVVKAEGSAIQKKEALIKALERCRDMANNDEVKEWCRKVIGTLRGVDSDQVLRAVADSIVEELMWMMFRAPNQSGVGSSGQSDGYSIGRQ